MAICEKEARFFSVLIPAYNAEKYINQCIDSVLNQSFLDFELLIVDDGSDDATSKICDEYMAVDGRVRVLHCVNSGVSVSRNILLSNARGKYFIFLDADDFWTSKSFLQNIYDVIKREKVDVICWWTQLYNNSDGSVKNENNSINAANYVSSGKEFLRSALTAGMFHWWLWMYAISERLWNDSGFRFNAERKICEDEEVLFKVILQADSVWCMSEYYHCYRIENKQSAMGEITKIHFQDMLKVAQNNIEYVEMSDFIDNMLKKNLVRNFASVYFKLLLRIINVPDFQKEEFLQILAPYRWMLKKSLGSLGFWFNLKVILVIIFGNRIGLSILYLIEKIKN